MSRFGALRSDTVINVSGGDGDIILDPPGTPAENLAMWNAKVAQTIGASRFGRRLIIPPFTYQFADTVEIFNTNQLIIQGFGGLSRIQYIGSDPTKPIMSLNHCFQPALRDCQLLAGQRAYAGLRIFRNNQSGWTLVASRSETENVQIGGNLEYGIVVGGIGRFDNNNDFNVFKQLTVQGYAEAGFYLASSSQAYGNEMHSVSLGGGAGAKYGVLSDANHAANFSWFNGFLSAHQLADFSLGSTVQPYLIQGAHCENSKRFLLMNSSVYCSATVTGCRWAGNQLHEDGIAMDVSGGQHQLSLIGNLIGDANAGAQMRLKFRRGAWVDMSMNKIFSTAPNVFSDEVPGRMYGNLKYLQNTFITAQPLAEAG